VRQSVRLARCVCGLRRLRRARLDSAASSTGMMSRRLAPLGVLLISALAAAAPSTREVHDDTGATVRGPSQNCRLVSVAPGTTAMLFAVGAAPCLVGTIAHS